MTKGNGRMKKIVTLVFVLLTLLTAAASAESYTQADFEWAEAVQDQSTLTLKEQAKYLDIVKQRPRGIALLAMGGTRLSRLPAPRSWPSWRSMSTRGTRRSSRRIMC